MGMWSMNESMIHTVGETSGQARWASGKVLQARATSEKSMQTLLKEAVRSPTDDATVAIYMIEAYMHHIHCEFALIHSCLVSFDDGVGLLD